MKGQQQALSAILISGILIGVVGSVYFWGVPLIEKNKDVALLESGERFIKQLNEKIKFVANNGGRDQMVVAFPGIVSFDGEQIEFVLQTDGTIYASNSLIALGHNSGCTAESGEWGIDDPEIICVVSSAITNSTFRNTYNLRYIKLNQGLRTFEIDLTGPVRSAGQDHLIVMESKGVREIEDAGRATISTVVEINII